MSRSSDLLNEFRTEIDLIDEQLVRLLARRFQITAQVGRMKKEMALPPVDAGREAEQFSRYRTLAALHGLEPDMVVSLFRTIIDEVVINHGRSGRGGGQQDASQQADWHGHAVRL